MSPILPEVCHRTRQQVSLRLDTELSELEEALLAAHLRKCPTCWEFAVDLEALTEALRAAPLAEPSREFSLPRHPARIDVARTGKVAAVAVTVVIAVGGIVGLYPSPPQISASDIQNARERMILKEQLIEALEGTTVTPAQEIPHGLKAAKNATLTPIQGAG